LTKETFEDRINELVSRAKKDPEWMMKILVALVDAIKKKACYRLYSYYYNAGYSNGSKAYYH